MCADFSKAENEIPEAMKQAPKGGSSEFNESNC